jgi:hypothetical protein
MADVEQGKQQSGSGESASLKGKGWDILVGGKEKSFEMGGEDPFDLKAEASSTEVAPENPFADDDLDALLDELAADSQTFASEARPEDAFWDRGRGAEAPEPSAAPGALAELPPRDLSPEELGKLPPLPVAGETAPPVEEIMGPSRDSIPQTGPTISVSKPTISDDELANLLKQPEITSNEVAVRTVAASPAPSTPAPAARATLVKALDFEITDPFLPEIMTPGAAAPDLAPDKDMEKLLITPERINRLWDEINQTYDYVVADVRGHFNTTEQAITDLKKARDLLLAGAQYFDNAEQLVIQVKARLRLEEKVRQWSRSRGTWLAVYLVVWFAVLVVIIGATLGSNAVERMTGTMPEWIVGAVLPMLFGGLGATIGALWVLNKHIVKKRDFDPIHTPWYVTNPFMGLMLGIVTYLVLRVGSAGLISLSGISEQPDFTAPSLVLYVICVIVGFQQNVLWTLLDRLVNLLIPQREKEDKAVTDSDKKEPVD